MEIFQSVVLGIVQGLTEFLPISSSAHLILTPYLLGWTDPGLAFDVALHMGTLLALIIFFWKDWLAIVQKRDLRFIGCLVVGTLPGAIAGLLLNKIIEEKLRDPMLIAGTLIAFGLLLWFFDWKGKKGREMDQITYTDAFLVGLAQAVALVPGVSRSGVTITTALALGFSRPTAMRFSFLLSAPIIAGAGLMKSKHILALASDATIAPQVAAGFLSSVVSGIAAIVILNYIVKTRTLAPFALYRFVLAFVIISVTVVRT